MRERDGDIWILWLFAANASRFEESLHDVADQIRLPGRRDPKADILKLLQTWLADASQRWMIVLDNADDAGFLLEPPPITDTVRATKRRIDYIPSCNHGTVVITSRSKDEAYKFVDENSVIEVIPFDVVHARTLLQKKLGPLYDEGSATKLATSLDFMPLALSQAASFIKQKRKYSIERYLAELEKSRQSRTSLLRQHGTVPKRDRQASSSIILTWQISFEHIHNECRSAADLLALMSFCDRQAIPEFLLHDAKGSRATSEIATSDEEEYKETFDDDIQMLENFSFVATTTDATTWDMHRLVQDAMQWWLLDHDRMEDMKQCYISRLYTVMPTGAYKNWKTCELLLPHSENAITTISGEREVAIQQADILYKMAWYAWQRGLIEDAISGALNSLSIRAKWLGEENHDSVSSMGMLALANAAAGRFKGAEELQVKVMEITKRVLGEEHPNTLTSMSNLAATYRDQGRYEDAKELQVKVMEITKRVLGEEHPNTLTSMGNLALTYRGQGRYEDAKELQVKVMEIEKRVLGEEHPDTLTTMSNLAVTFFYQGRLGDASKLMRQCIQSRSAVLGGGHPRTVLSVEWLWKIEMQMQTQTVNSEETKVNVTDLIIADANADADAEEEEV